MSVTNEIKPNASGRSPQISIPRFRAQLTLNFLPALSKCECNLVDCFYFKSSGTKTRASGPAYLRGERRRTRGGKATVGRGELGVGGAI